MFKPSLFGKKWVCSSQELPGRFKKELRDYPQSYKKIREFRWTEYQNLHITAYFIGGVLEENVSEIEQQLEDLFLKIEPFKIEFEDIIYGPPDGSPRMIWAVFSDKVGSASGGKDKGEYKNLADKVYESLKNVAPEDNRTKGAIIHITLARFKIPSISKSVELRPIDIRDTVINVSSCDLIESKLSPKGPSYNIIKRLNFKPL